MSEAGKLTFTSEQKAFAKAEMKNKKPEIVFICAVDCEYRRFLEYLKDKEIVFLEDTDTLLRGYSRRLFMLGEGEDRHLCLLVKQKDDGMVPCACLCSKILQYKPKLVVMTGICGGVPAKVNRGDLVVVKSTFDYGAGKYTENGTFKPKYSHIKMGDDLLEEACINVGDHFDEVKAGCDKSIYELPLLSGGYKKANPDDLKVETGMMVTGAAVVNCKRIIDEVTSRQRNVIAYDMEAYSLGYMCDADEVSWLVVKGVQDLANTPAREKDEYNRLAAYLSVAFAIEVVCQYIDGLQHLDKE